MNQPQMAPNGPEMSTLTPRQEAAALALASGCNLRDASRKSGAGQRTIKTWTATCPAFTRRISELRGEMTRRALGKLVNSMTDAANTLRRLLRAKSRTVRLGAARAILELGHKLRESTELEERIEALEQGRQTGPRGMRIA